MKKLVILMVAVLAAASLIACDDHAKSDGTSFEISGPVPVLIDRGILTDVLMGTGGEYPQNESCVASSMLVFDADINPFTIKKNTTSADSYNVSPAVITSSINVTVYADDEGRSDTCPAEDTAYIISASDQTPIDIQAVEEGCPALADIATEDGVAFPSTGVVIADLQGVVVSKVLSGNCDDPESTDCVKDSRNMIQLVVQECRP